MQIEQKVKLANCETIFTIDCLVNGYALLRRDDKGEYIDWWHCNDLIAL